MYTGAHGLTALFDGVYLGLSQMRGAHNTKKALLILSDGGDNHSRYSETEVRKFVREADVQIYAIGLFDPDGGPTPEEREGPSLLSDLTMMTGGRTFVVKNVNQLPDIATKISMELRNQYVIGYRPSQRAHDGKWRKIKVRLNPPKGLPPLDSFRKKRVFRAGPLALFLSVILQNSLSLCACFFICPVHARAESAADYRAVQSPAASGYVHAGSAGHIRGSQAQSGRGIGGAACDGGGR